MNFPHETTRWVRFAPRARACHPAEPRQGRAAREAGTLPRGPRQNSAGAPKSKRVSIPIVAAGLMATSLAFTPGSAWADETPSASPSSSPSGSPTSSPSSSPTSSPTSSPSGTPTTSAPTPTDTGAFSGYSATGIASPIKIEIFEPTIPIPTVPQAEFDFGYARVKADSASTKGRASFMWPGDGVGEGLKTFFSQLGLPTSLVENGYPVQVNSQHPSGDTKQTNSPFPGTSMTTTSRDGSARATVGFSNDCNAGDGAGDDSGDSSETGGVLPGLPGVPLLDNLNDILGVLGLGRAASTSRGFSRAGADDPVEDPADADVCQLPAALSALIDVNGYVADSQSVSDGSVVTSTSRAALGDVRLLGGLVTMSGITSTVVSSSDGTTGESQGRADYGTMTIAGQTFGLGPEGYVVQGNPSPIPGLPDNPTAALAALGITVEQPKPTYKAEGDKASGTIDTLIVTIDLKTLKPVLSQLPLGAILAPVPFPPDAALLKSLLSSIGNLSPKIVIHLGYTTSAVDTVQSIPIPDSVPDNDPTSEPTESEDDTSGGATGGDPGLGADTSGLPPADTSTPDTDAAPDQLATTSATAGLPPLFSIPGMLLFAGLGGALLAGSYFRRLGAMVLGAGGACAHGLESGLPDLRKVQ